MFLCTHYGQRVFDCCVLHVGVVLGLWVDHHRTETFTFGPRHFDRR